MNNNLMTTNQTSVDVRNPQIISAADFVSRLHGLANDLAALATDYAYSVDANPSLEDQILAATTIEKKFLQRLYNVGKGLTDSRLLLDFSPFANRVSQLPIQTQSKLLAATAIPIVSRTNPSQIKLVNPKQLDNGDIAQAFTKVGLRDVVDQNTYIQKKHEDTSLYSIIDGTVSFRRGCTLTKKDVQSILKKL